MQVRVRLGAGLSRLSAAPQMTIDLSDVTVPTKRKDRKLKPVGKPETVLRVENLEFVARPLLVEKARLQIAMTATDAKLDLRRDKRGRPMLTLSGAEDGRVTMEVSKKDVDALLLQNARESAGKYGVAVVPTVVAVSGDGTVLRRLAP